MSEIFKISGLLLLSALKFLLAPGSIYAVGYNFWGTILISTIGGWMGVLGFFYFGKIILGFFQWFSLRLRTGPVKPKRKMTRTNRMIVKIKRHHMGIIVLALITPTLTSIPVGSVIAARFFRYDRWTVPLLFLGVLFWAFVLTTLAHFFNIRL